MSIQPFLAGFATKRSGEKTMPGRYDVDRSVWVLDEIDGPVPMVEKARDLADLVTKTKVDQEKDDPGIVALLDLVTKTDARKERDD